MSNFGHSLTWKLIRLVRSYPNLYNTNSRYKSNEEKNEIWTRISDELGLGNCELARAKWRNLRDSYVKYCKCSVNPAKRPSLRKYSRWPWSEEMEFLKPFMPTADLKLKHESTEADESNDPAAAEVQEASEAPVDVEEEQRLYERYPTKRPKLQSPEEVMTRRLSNMEAIDHLFLSYAQTTKTFSHKRQVMIKSQLATLMNQAELDEIAEQEEAQNNLQHHFEYS